MRVCDLEFVGKIMWHSGVFLKRGPINYQLPSVVFELRQVSTIVTTTSLKRTRAVAVAGAVARH